MGIKLSPESAIRYEPHRRPLWWPLSASTPKGPIGHPDKASERDEVDIQGWQCGTRVSGIASPGTVVAGPSPRGPGKGGMCNARGEPRSAPRDDVIDSVYWAFQQGSDVRETRIMTGLTAGSSTSSRRSEHSISARPSAQHRPIAATPS